MKEYKYKAFISYSHKDKNFAKWLHRRIENYKIPKSLREKYPHLPANLQRSIFRDEEELPTASELSDNLLYAMNNSELLLVVCSPASVKSKWVNSEIQYYKRMYGENSVLAIIKEGEPNATDMDDEYNEALPNALRHKVDSLGGLTQERTEPIAGDARSYWDREMALMKMIAGILKVDFADLWEREKKEKKKRNMIASGFIVLFMILGIYASTQFVGDKVNREYEKIKNDIAVIEYSLRHDNLGHEVFIELEKELENLKKIKEAKENTQKILGTLKTSIGKEAQVVYRDKGAAEAIKILTSRDAISRKEQLKKELSLEDIALAKLYIETYQFEKAQQSYENAIETFFDYSTSIEYGNFLYNQKRYTEAIKLYKKLFKNNKLNQEQKCKVYLSLGNSIYSQEILSTDAYKQKIADTEDAFLHSLNIARELAKENESKHAYMLALSLNNLSVFYRDASNYIKAEELLDESLKLSKKLVTTDKNDEANGLMALIYFNKGALNIAKQEYKEVEHFYFKALSIFEILNINNPKLYNDRIAMIFDALGELYIITKKKEVETMNLNSLKEYTTLAKDNPEAYCGRFKITTLKLANLYKKNMSFDKAEMIYIGALNICNHYPKFLPFNKDSINSYLCNLYYDSKQLSKLEKCYEKFEQNNVLKYNINEASILIKLAQLYIESTEVKKAEQLYTKAIEIYIGLNSRNNKKSILDEILHNGNTLSIAWTLNRIGELYEKMQQFDKAEKAYAESLSIYRGLEKTTANILSIAWTLSRLGELHEKDKQIHEAKKIYKEILSIYEELEMSNPEIYKTHLIWIHDKINNLPKKII